MNERELLVRLVWEVAATKHWLRHTETFEQAYPRVQAEIQRRFSELRAELSPDQYLDDWALILLQGHK